MSSQKSGQQGENPEMVRSFKGQISCDYKKLAEVGEEDVQKSVKSKKSRKAVKPRKETPVRRKKSGKSEVERSGKTKNNRDSEESDDNQVDGATTEKDTEFSQRHRSGFQSGGLQLGRWSGDGFGPGQTIGVG